MTKPVLEQPRNVALIKVHIDVLMDILTTGWNGSGLYCVRGIPPGAKFVRADYMPEYGAYYIMVEHDSFEPVYRGEAPIDITCQFVREVMQGEADE